jgi:hypothetical protein
MGLTSKWREGMERDIELINKLAKHFADKGTAMGYGISCVLSILGVILLMDDRDELERLVGYTNEVAKYQTAMIAEALRQSTRQPIKSSQP